MADNDYSVLTSRMAHELGVGLIPRFAGIEIVRKVFKPNDLADFTKWCIVISPPAAPWEERRTAIPEVQYLYRVDLFFLVKNFDETLSLFGTVAPDLGLFQMIHEVKEILRLSDFGGLLDKTYDEPAGPLNFEGSAVQAFDTGEKAFIHRARLAYTARAKPFCHPRL